MNDPPIALKSSDGHIRNTPPFENREGRGILTRGDSIRERLGQRPSLNESNSKCGPTRQPHFGVIRGIKLKRWASPPKDWLVTNSFVGAVLRVPAAQSVALVPASPWTGFRDPVR